MRASKLSRGPNRSRRRKGLAAGLSLLWLCLPLVGRPAEPPQTLEALVEQVQHNRRAQRRLNEKRVARFLAARQKRQAMLKKARAALKAAKAREEKLTRMFEQNEKKLAGLEAELRQRSASLEGVFNTARQAAESLLHTLNHSLISAQFPKRGQALSAITESEALPTIEDLRRLWLAFLKHMAATGQVVTFSAPVITPAGKVDQRRVSRIGPFTAVSEGRYLRYLADVGLVEPSQQPASRLLELAAAFAKADPGEVVPMAVDPSRGAILSVVVHSPNLLERIHQGGWIGYLTIALGAIALLIALQRFIALWGIGRRMARQRDERRPREDNPLGRILGVYADEDDAVETLHLKLDEAIMKELPAIERGLPTLSMVAEIAPLLGLLGTVVGMIITFQTITMFGSNDPQLMAAGISKALVTTVLGLVVAIPLLLIHSGLSSKSNRLVQILDEESAAIVAQLAEARQAEGDSADGSHA